MLITILTLLLALVAVPALCVYTLCREDVDPSIQFVAILVLAPFVHLLLLILRRNL